MSVKDITVVIATFKSSEKIENCLNSISKECQVLIIENSKDFELKKDIEAKFSNVKCIVADSNLGYGKSNNLALKKVNTKYALILNPDTTLHPSALENFLKAAKKIPEFAIMGPKNQIAINKSNLPVEVNNIKGFAMFLNLSEFQKIGFFDENFFMYFEEIDLCKRIKQTGKKIYSLPDVEIYHEGASSTEQSIKKEIELSRNWHWMWSTFYYHKKYKGFFISLLIVFPKLSSAIIKVIIYSLTLNNEKKKIYYHRLSGLINAIMSRKSWYRAKV